MLQVLGKDESHRYLGRMLNLDPEKRVEIEFRNRVQVCWMKFQKQRYILINPDIPIRLRMKLFDAICSPTILFGLAVLPLTLKKREALDVLQRRMLRLIVGWKRLPGEDWAITMHRMKGRLEKADAIYPIASWQECFHRQRWRYAVHVAKDSKSKWMYKLSQYCPDSIVDEEVKAHRNPGRPFLRWDDSLHDYCGYEWSMRHWLELENWSKEKALEIEDRYVQYCML